MMSKKMFTEMQSLLIEIKRLDKNIADMKKDLNALSNTCDNVCGSGSDYPFTLHSIPITGVSPMDSKQAQALREQISKTTTLLQAKRNLYICAYVKLEKAVENIADVDLRTIVMFRFGNGMSWFQVASSMTELHHYKKIYTAESVRAKFKRYLKNEG